MEITQPEIKEKDGYSIKCQDTGPRFCKTWIYSNTDLCANVQRLQPSK